MSVFRTNVSMLAEVVQALFVWSIVALALWRAFRPSLDVATWRKWLGRCLWVGIGGGLLGAIAFVGSMGEQYFYSDETGRYTLIDRWTGPYAAGFWAQPLVLVLLSVLLFVTRRRSSWWIAWIIALLLCSLLASFERFVIFMTSLHRDYLPSSWTFSHEVIKYMIPPIALLLSAGIMLWAQRRQRVHATE